MVAAARMTMTGYSPDEDRQPLTWWNGYPIYTSTLLVVVHVASLLLTTILVSTGWSGLGSLIFSSEAVFHRAAIWQYFTYAFIHEPSIGFAIEMLLLFQFGREVEQFFGRKIFLLLYVSVLLFSPLVLTVTALLFGPSVFAGSSILHFSILVAFACIYPGTVIFWAVRSKWIAWILLGIYTLEDLQANAWSDLMVLWTTASFTFGFVQWQRGRLSLPNWREIFRRKPKFSVVRGNSSPSRPPSPREKKSETDVLDSLLDKIAKHGLQSLTPKEQTALEAARAALLRKERR